MGQVVTVEVIMDDILVWGEVILQYHERANQTAE